MNSEDSIHEAKARIDQRFEDQLVSRTGDALDTEGAQIYIRKVNGRLLWIEANRYGGGKSWEELTPDLAQDRLTRSSVGEVDEESLTKLRDLLIAAQNPEAYEIGWYQDSKGDLYQFDGKTWVGKMPNKTVRETFEFLG